jgi:copper chaperone NosL
MKVHGSSFAALVLALATAACDAGPRALVAGEDACRYCRMTIDDVRFGALVQTSRGRLETFDSIECLASFVNAMPAAEKPRGVWVTDFDAPGTWIPVERARFLQQSSIKSPMGRELAAFSGDVSPDELVRRHGGRPLTWAEVTALVARTLAAPTASRSIVPLAMPARAMASLAVAR